MNRQSALLTLALVLLGVFATAFAFINYSNSVKVWPLMTSHPLTLVIGVSFLLGAGVGALAVKLMSNRRMQMTATNTPDPLLTRSGKRDHPGRP